MTSHWLVLALAILAVVFVANADGKIKDKFKPDISWVSSSRSAKKMKNCNMEYLTAPLVTKSYRSNNHNNPMVGIFVTRYEPSNDIWGSGTIRGNRLVKKLCHRYSRASISVLGGSDREPTAVDIKMKNKLSILCSYGYTIKICYKN